MVELTIVLPDDDLAEPGQGSDVQATGLLELGDFLRAAGGLEVGFARGPSPGGAKGAGAVFGLIGRAVGGEALRTALAALVNWAGRSGRTVEVCLDGDTIKLGGASREQQDRIVEAWIARHAPSA